MTTTSMSGLPVRRRLQRYVVRYQARLEAGAGDRWLPPAFTVALAVVLMWTALARITSLGTGVDLAGYTQAVWLLGEGTMPQASLFGSDVHLLQLHWSFIMYPLAALGLIFPPAQMLVIVQALALAIAVLPLWRLARVVANLRVGAAAALTLAYALHPATHRLGTEDFHPETLAVPAIIGMAYFGSTKRWVLYWICVAIILACRADLGLAVALWGFVVLGARERTVAVWTLGVGLVWSLGFLLVVAPILGDAGAIPGRFGVTGTSLGEVVLSSARDPVSLVRDLVARENITLVVRLLAPLIFLPLLSLRYLAPATPLAVVYLIADLDPETAFAERGSMLLAFMMIAAAHALNRLGNMGVDRVFLDVRVLTTLAAASVLLFVAQSPISPYEKPWEWNRLDSTDQAILDAIDSLGADVPVRAAPSSLVALAERPWLFAVDPETEPSAVQAAFPDFTQAVLIVEREIPERTDDEREDFDRNMAGQGYQILIDDRANGVALYSRAGLGSAQGG